MVFFSCDGCAEMLKKSKVPAHVSKCYSCTSVSCVDCSVSFYGDDYRQHTSCVTEAERYEKSIYKGPKKGSKVTPQQLWVEVVNNAVDDAPADIRGELEALTELSVDNVPRKEKQFRNFVANSLKLRDATRVGRIWQHLMSKKEQQATDRNKANANDKSKFNDKSKTPVEREKDELIHTQSSEQDKAKQKINDENCITDVEKHVSSCPSDKDVGKVVRKILKAAPSRSMKMKELRSRVQIKFPSFHKKSLKRAIEQIFEADTSKKIKLDGKVASYVTI